MMNFGGAIQIVVRIPHTDSLGDWIAMLRVVACALVGTMRYVEFYCCQLTVVIKVV